LTVKGADLDLGLARARRALRLGGRLTRRRLANWLGDGGPHSLRGRVDGRRFVTALSNTDHLTHLGGMQLCMQHEQAYLAGAGVAYLHLFPEQGRVVGSLDQAYVGSYRLDDVSAGLSGAGGCEAAHIHHLMGWDLAAVGAFLAALRPPRIRWFVHDYYSISDDENLLHRRDSPEHLAAMRRLLGQLAQTGTLEVIAPSPTAADLFVAAHPQLAPLLRVVPHKQLVPGGTPPRASEGRPRLAFVGYASPAKGFGEWRALAETREIRDRFELWHFGHCGGACPEGVLHRNVYVDARDDDAMRRTLARRGIDLAFLWSIWPETFSFTCHEAMAAGAFVLTNERSGNIAAEVRLTGRGRVLPDLGAVRRFLLDPAELTRARAAARGEIPRGVWVDTLSRELTR
jgi:hypothetical protein